jgi:lipopolysaccharide/colanic/teichoic acid biosynthesis glycosyltransferase
MHKRGQIAFDSSAFGQNSQTENYEKPNLFKRLLMGIVAIIFLILFLPVLSAIHSAISPYVCSNPTVCLFFKFIVPAFILGGIMAGIKEVWGRQ